MRRQTGITLWNKAKKLIPGGTQLLSKRTEMFLPEQWPSYYNKAKGVEIWDLDDNKFIDMSIMGVGACILGYADDDVNESVKNVIDNGSMSTLNVPEEVELAELLIKLHPWAGAVRYARTGGEAMTIAVRIARACSKKDQIAFCGYHGWHDWYLSSNLSDNKNLDGHLLKGLEPNGVPRKLINTAIPFEYNKIEQLETIIKKNDIGTIIVEPFRHKAPRYNFLQKVRSIANENECILIFDEITSGWRMCIGGVHLKMKVNPDIAVFGKAISNGYPMSTIIGKKEVMNTAQTSFISSTYWTERIGPVAALATIRKIQSKNVPAHLDFVGNMIGVGWKKLAKNHSLNIEILPPNALITFIFNYKNSQEIKTLFTQEMLKKGYLASSSVYVSYRHTKEIIEDYLKAVNETFKYIAQGIKENNIYELLEGPVCHVGFQRLT